MKTIFLSADTSSPQVNGVVTAITETIKILEKRGFRVVFIHPGLFKTVAFPFYPEVQLAISPKRKILKILSNSPKIDFVHIMSEGPVGAALRSICKEKKIPFTTSYHTHLPKYLKIYLGLFSALIYGFLRWFHGAAEKTMVSTESLKKELEKHFLKNIVVCPLGVDTNSFVKNPNPSLPPLPKPVFVSFGRVSKEKGIEEFLKCDLPGTKLVIGDGPTKEELERKYKDKALFVGYKKGQELIDWLSLCDVCVFPSRTETFGLSALEALSCSIPIAAHNCMGPKDIVTHGVDGFLDEDLEKAAMACLGLNREKCREKALQFSWEKSVDTFVSNLVEAKEERKEKTLNP